MLGVYGCCGVLKLSLSFAADLFTIDELSVYEGTADEQTYVVAGDIIDGVSGHQLEFFN